MKRFFKIFLIAFITIISLLFITSAVVANFVLTPEKVTPLIIKVASSQLKTKLEFGSVDVSLFGNFPYVGVTIKDGSILSTKSIRNDADSLKIVVPQAQDTLIKFSSINIWLNPLKYLYNSSIVIRTVDIVNPHINLLVGKNGEASWDILKESTDVTVADTTAVDLGITGISLDNFSIVDANLIYNNKQNGMYTEIGKYNLNLLGDLGAKDSRLKLKTSMVNASLMQYKNVLFKDFDFKMITYVTGSKDTDMLVLEDGEITINNVKFKSSGFLGKDTISVNTYINTGNIQELINVIPESIVKQNHKFSSKGSIEVTSNVHGNFNGGRIPIIEGVVKAKNISAQYDGLKYKLDQFSTNTKYYLDLNNKYKSYVDVKLLQFKSANNLVDLKSKIAHPLTNPIFSVTGRADLNLEEISEMVPLSDSVKIGGSVGFNGRLVINMEQINKGDYGRIAANAKLNLKDIEIYAPTQQVKLHLTNTVAVMNNDKNGYLRVSAELQDAKYQVIGETDVTFSQMTAKFEGNGAKDSTSILSGEIFCDGLIANVQNDMAAIKIAKFSSDVKLSNREIAIKLNTDSLSASFGDYVALLNNANIDLYSLNKKMYGAVKFSNLVASSKSLTMPIIMESTELKIDKSVVNLTGVKMKIGRTNLKLTGVAYNISEMIKNTGKLHINSKLESSYVDVSELTNIYAPVKDTVVNTATDEMTVFVVPNNLVLNFDLEINKAAFNGIEISDIRGKLNLDNSKITLSNIAMNALNAKLRSAAEYRASDKSGAFSRFVMAVDEIDAQNTIKLIPAIDSILPLIKSLSGIVSIRIAADAKLDSKMSLDLNSMDGAINLRGHDIELKDSKALAEVADMLMFKAKESSIIENLGINLLIDTGRVEVFPFKVSLNRYVVAIGGEHFLNNTFKYHISVLKSPVPFKMGINIIGKNLDDWDMKFGKAIYKKDNAPTDYDVINPEFAAEWEMLSKGLNYNRDETVK